MKKLILLFIFSIGMIGLTSMASTPSMEQKQKTTISKAIVSPLVANVVTFDIISFDDVKIQKSNLKAQFLVNKMQPITLFVVNNDVGLTNYNEVSLFTFYKEIQKPEVVFIHPLTRNCRSNC